MIEGVLAASITPLDKDLRINTPRFIEHCHWLLENGCNAVALFGTTGEANSFSVKERIQALDQISLSSLDMANFIVGTGCCALEDTVELTSHALRVGASGVLMLPPFYYKNITDTGLFTYFSKVIEKTANAGLKIYLYNFPQMTGISFSHDLIEMLRKEFPENIQGIKDSSGNFDNMKQMIHRFPGFQVFSGTEKYLKPVIEEGGAGCISATVNVTAKLAGQVYNEWKNGKDTTQVQEQLNEIRMFIEKFPMIPAIKKVLSVWYTDDNLLFVKPPHLPLLPSDANKLIKSGYFDMMLSGRE